MFGMRHVHVTSSTGSRAPGADCVVLVDGQLDVVSAHDLRRALAGQYADGHRHVHLDLSGVTSADAAGIAGLSACSDLAITEGRVLTWSRCSRPLLDALTEGARRPA